jgi:hypothetical protein
MVGARNDIVEQSAKEENRYNVGNVRIIMNVAKLSAASGAKTQRTSKALVKRHSLNIVLRLIFL